MRNLALGALFVGLLAACGGGNSVKIKLDGSNGKMDGSGSGSAAACNILTQTGCNNGEKCSWIHDQTMPTAISHVGCAPDGTVAVGAACMYGSPPMGWDNCKSGGVCEGGVCKQICDQQGGAPMCDTTHSCQVYEGFLGPPQMEAAGVCDPTCHPLDDNYFGGTTRTGTACGSGEGCYGFWSGGPGQSHFSCASVPPHGVNPPPPGSNALFHRAACATASGCANAGGSPYLNGCASGYMPYITDDLAGMNTFVCIAFCKPADCTVTATPGCGTAGANRVGASPHRCNQTDAMGTFNPAANGDQCVYGWVFEIGSDNVTVLKSNYSDTTGFCMDHSKYHLLDSTGMTRTNDAWPACATLPLTAAGSNCFGGSGATGTNGCTAQDFGCVSTTTGMIPTMFNGQPRNVHIEMPRAPYHALVAPNEQL
jgi:hypothetical protein